MFKFEFSNKKTISRDVTTYPITLATVKAKSFYFIDNPTDESQETYITSLIASVMLNWEDYTGYLIQDQTVKAFVPNIRDVNDYNLQIDLTNLNIRTIDYVKYYPYDWDQAEAKTTLDSSYYLITDELNRVPSSLKMLYDYVPLQLFSIKNNLEVQYAAGFEDNDFTDLNQQIIDALSMQVAAAVDVKNGYCEDYYSGLIKEVYAKYSIQKQQISFI